MSSRIFVLLLVLVNFAHSTEKYIPCEVLFGNPEKASPILSPEGDRFAYLAPHDEHNKALNLWVRSLDKQDDHVVTNVEGRSIAGHLWTYDGKSLLYLYDKDGRENFQLYRVNLETGISTCLTPFENTRVGLIEYVKKYPNKLLISMNKENPALFDAYELDLDTGSCTMTFKNPGKALELISDKNLQIRCITQITDDGGTDVLVRTAATEPWKTLLHWDIEDSANSRVIGFNHEDNKLYILDSRSRNTNSFAQIDVSTNTQSTLFQDNQSQYDIVSVLFTPDMSSPIAAITLAEKKQITVLNKEFEQDFKILATLTHGEIVSLSHNNVNTHWIVGFSHDTAPVRYYYYNRTTKQASFLFSCRPALEQYHLLPMYPISFTASDGLQIHGYLTHSAQAYNKQPLVLLVHGGPWWRDCWGYDPEVQFLANRGYACLQINYRGSTGYGKNFLNAGNKEWGRRVHQDLVEAVQWAIKNNIAEPTHIAIMGGSYGGYAALCGAAFNSDLFCCSVSLFGFSNIITLCKNKPAYWKSAEDMWKKRVGDVKTEEAMLKERSPLFSAQHIKCPMLIVQGKNDIRCTPEESEQMLYELKKHNIPYCYLEFDNEGHGIVNQEKRISLFADIEKFFAQYLGTK